MRYEDLVPLNSAITWADVSRFSGNNVIGNRRRKHLLKNYDDAGKCLGRMADEAGEFIPANKWKAVADLGLTAAEFKECVAAAAKDITDQRARADEPEEYWRFIFENCWNLFSELFEGGGEK